MQIQWYPGHMTKTRRMLTEDIKLVDLIIELTDARAPQSARNPDFDQLFSGKKRVLLLNKADMADRTVTAAFLRFYRSSSLLVDKIDARKTKTVKALLPLLEEACAEKFAREKKLGMKKRPIRAMVVGIPNIGKSTFINSFAGKASAKTGNKPGVTLGKQWIRMGANVELLDTPGLLWPKFDDQTTAVRLALLGAINEQILPVRELALYLIPYLNEHYPGVLEKRYDLDESLSAETQLADIAARRGLLAGAGAIDEEKAGVLLLDEFKNGIIGKISLEKPECL